MIPTYSVDDLTGGLRFNVSKCNENWIYDSNCNFNIGLDS